MELQIKDIETLLGHSPRVILECGANDGEHSEQFVHTYPECQLMCFEPDPRAVEKWKLRLGHHPRAKLWQVALSDENGTATFHQSDGRPPGRDDLDEHWDKSGSLQRPLGHLDWSPWCTFDTTIDVMTTKLDVWMHSWLSLQPLSEVDFCWIDTQGAEARVLKGATETLPKIKALYVECHNQTTFGPLYENYPTLDELDALLPTHIRQPENYSENYLWKRRDLP